MKRFALLTALMLLSACAAESPPPPGSIVPHGALEPPGDVTPAGTGETERQNEEEYNMQNPIVTITMDGGGVIKIELYPDKAPNTVANFINLIQSGFYDGLVFHRISPTFMIQGGCPDGNGSGGPGHFIHGEFASNGFAQNDISHTRGVISMARRSFPLDSAGSQFFIVTSDSRFLDGEYAAFGRVLEGMDIADSIASGPIADPQSMRALEPRSMQTVTADTFGAEYSAVVIR
jgi:peptidyl-prolyl cis-trans isomerase B (cyclophilin B)